MRSPAESKGAAEEARPGPSDSEPATPRMLLRPCLGMRSQEMVEHMEKRHDMLLVVMRLAGADVVHNHVANLLGAVLLAR